MRSSRSCDASVPNVSAGWFMTVVVDAYNQTDGSYRNVQAQQGIDQVFLTMRTSVRAK